MSNYVNTLTDKYDIEKNQINLLAIKVMINVLIKNNEAFLNNKELIINEDIFKIFINLYRDFQNYFDLNYNRKSDLVYFFSALYNSIKNSEIISFDALFCPGYSQNGYKENLGSTTKWKLKMLKDMSLFLQKKNILHKINCYYSDVFLENTDYDLEPKWREQLEVNKNAFHIEGEKYFDKNQVLNMSQIPIFSGSENTKGYIDKNIIKEIPISTYNSFKKCNKRFYDKIGFSDEQITFRNDRLITMYRIYSNYLNSKNNLVFLPMENMYERENIFSENGTCTMYLKLKNKEKYYE